MDILDDMGVSKLSANVFLKVNYSFKEVNSVGHVIAKDEAQVKEKTELCEKATSSEKRRDVPALNND